MKVSRENMNLRYRRRWARRRLVIAVVLVVAGTLVLSQVLLQAGEWLWK